MPFNPDRMAALRRKRKLSQEKLGDLIGVSQQQIASYENGQRTPAGKTLEKLADALKTTVDYLLNRSDQSEPLRESDLTTDEKAWLRAFRNRDAKQAQRVIGKWLQEKLDSDPDLATG